MPVLSEEKTELKTDEIIALISTIWKAKKDSSLSLKAEVKELTMPDKFKSLESDIITSNNIKKVSYGNEIKINI